MADIGNADELTFADGSEEGQSAARGTGADPRLSRLLLFFGIGLGVVIVTVAVSAIGAEIVSHRGSPAATISNYENYGTATPLYQYVGTIGEIRTHTSDTPAYAITVRIILGFDMKDQDSPVEVNGRMPEIRDFLRRYFTEKLAADLTPDREQILKDDIRDNLNHILSKPSVKEVLFDQLDVMKIEV